MSVCVVCDDERIRGRNDAFKIELNRKKFGAFKFICNQCWADLKNLHNHEKVYRPGSASWVCRSCKEQGADENEYEKLIMEKK